MEQLGNGRDRVLRLLLPERAALSAYLYVRLEDWEDVAEALRETARLAGRRCRDAPTGAGFGPWIRGCARDALRRRGADTAGGLLEGVDGPDLEAVWARCGGVTPEREEELAGRLRALPALSQRLVKLHYREGIPCGRIAARYKERVESVHRALVRLRSRLAGTTGDDAAEAGGAKERERWDLAVERYIEGTLFPSERASLRKRLAGDPALRARLVESVAQEAALRWIHRPEREDPLQAVSGDPGPRAWWGVAAGVLTAAGAVAWLAGEGPARPAPFRDAPGAPLNASFEADDDGDGRPDFWTNDRVRRDTAIFHDGAASLRIDDPGGAGVSSPPILSLEAGTRVRVSAWVRTRGVEPAPGRGVRLRLVRPGPDNRILGATTWIGGNRDWQRVSFEVDVPRDCREGRLEIEWSLGGGGTVWVDGVGLERW